MSGSLERLASGCILAGFAGTKTRPTGSSASSTTGSAASCSSPATSRGRSSCDALTESTPGVAPRPSSRSTRRAGTSPGSRRAAAARCPGPLALGDDRRRRAHRAASPAPSPTSSRAAGITLEPRPRRRRQRQPAQPGDRRPLVRLRPGARLPPRRRVRDRAPGGRRRRLREALSRPRRHRGRLAPRPARSSRRRARSCSRSSSLPFRAAIAAGTRAIMSAHLVVPAIDAVPATLSRAHAHRAAARRARLHRHDRHRRARDEGGERDGRDGGGRRAGARSPAPTRSASGTTSTRGTSRACGRRSSRRCGRDGSTRSGSRRRPPASRPSHVPAAPSRSDAPPFAELGLAAARRALVVTGTVVDGRAAAARRPRGHDLGRRRAAVTRSRVDPARAGRRRRDHPDPRRARLDAGARRCSGAARIAGRWSSSATSTVIRGSGHAAAAILAADHERRSSSTSATRPRSADAQRPHHDVRAGPREPDGRRRAAARISVTGYGRWRRRREPQPRRPRCDRTDRARRRGARSR